MRLRQLSPLIRCVIASALLAFPATAEESHAGSVEHASAAEDHGGQAHHFKNGLALFLGATNEAGHGTQPTWGLEYARALSPHWAVGGLLDSAGGGQRNLVIAPMIVWKPFAGGGFALLAAPGIEYHNGRGEIDHHLVRADTGEEDQDETAFVMRFGSAYHFHGRARHGIGPAVNLDLVDGHEVWVYDANFEVLF